jgi:hypothetical protein
MFEQNMLPFVAPQTEAKKDSQTKESPKLQR